jgi:hypothetical protein
VVAALVAAFVSLLSVAALIEPWSFEVSVPLDAPSPEQLARMTDAEICQLEYRSFTGLDAFRQLGLSGLVLSFRYRWLVLFASVLAGCLLYGRLTRNDTAIPSRSQHT